MPARSSRVSGVGALFAVACWVAASLSRVRTTVKPRAVSRERRRKAKARVTSFSRRLSPMREPESWAPWAGSRTMMLRLRVLESAGALAVTGCSGGVGCWGSDGVVVEDARGLPGAAVWPVGAAAAVWACGRVVMVRGVARRGSAESLRIDGAGACWAVHQGGGVCWSVGGSRSLGTWADADDGRGGLLRRDLLLSGGKHGSQATCEAEQHADAESPAYWGGEVGSAKESLTMLLNSPDRRPRSGIGTLAHPIVSRVVTLG